jgi:hypothetical protein
MLEILYKDKWCEFQPIQLDYMIETIDRRSLDELPDKVYGKICMGVCGYKPIWMYNTVDKKKLRVRKHN